MFNDFIFAAGLSGLKDTVVNDWLGPLFLLGIAVFAIVFIKDRAWMKLLGFIGIAAVVGVLIFGTSDLFGEEGIFKNIAKDAGTQIDENKGGGGPKR